MFTQLNGYSRVLKKINNKYSIFEVKYFEKPLSIAKQKEEMEQVKAIQGLEVGEIGFVCSSGFEGKLDGVTYLDLKDILFSN